MFFTASGRKKKVKDIMGGGKRNWTSSIGSINPEKN